MKINQLILLTLFACVASTSCTPQRTSNSKSLSSSWTPIDGNGDGVIDGWLDTATGDYQGMCTASDTDYDGDCIPNDYDPNPLSAEPGDTDCWNTSIASNDLDADGIPDCLESDDEGFTFGQEIGLAAMQNIGDILGPIAEVLVAAQVYSDKDSALKDLEETEVCDSNSDDISQFGKSGDDNISANLSGTFSSSSKNTYQFAPEVGVDAGRYAYQSSNGATTAGTYIFYYNSAAGFNLLLTNIGDDGKTECHFMYIITNVSTCDSNSQIVQFNIGDSTFKNSNTSYCPTSTSTDPSSATVSSSASTEAELEVTPQGVSTKYIKSFADYYGSDCVFNDIDVKTCFNEYNTLGYQFSTDQLNEIYSFSQKCEELHLCNITGCDVDKCYVEVFY